MPAPQQTADQWIAYAVPTLFRHRAADHAAPSRQSGHVPASSTASHRSQRSGIPATLLARHPDAAQPWTAWIWTPLALFVLTNLWLVGMHGDIWLADRLYAAEGARWALRDSWATTTLIHVTGKHLSTLAWLAVLVSTIAARSMPRWRQLYRPLLALTLSIVATTVLVSLLKHATAMDCPWDAARYGGTHPLWTLLQARPEGIRASGCFPGGHASGGYCWVALYFFLIAVRPRWRMAGLAAGLLVGLLFGVSQQLRGAHFLSHDVWTLGIAWLSALCINVWWLQTVPMPSALRRPVHTRVA